jgi:hypothetical protein
MNRSRSTRIAALLLAVASTAAAAPQEGAPQALPRDEVREQNMRAYIELLRRDVQSMKVAVITEMMEMTDAEQKAFWPVYRDYEHGLATLNDERIAAVETYAAQYTKLTGPVADKLATDALDLEARRVALKQAYFKKLKGVLTPVRAARALQIENQIELLLDLQVAASLPVVR